MRGGSFMGIVTIGMGIPATLVYYWTRRVDYAMFAAITTYALTSS